MGEAQRLLLIRAVVVALPLGLGACRGCTGIDDIEVGEASTVGAGGASGTGSPSSGGGSPTSSSRGGSGPGAGGEDDGSSSASTSSLGGSSGQGGNCEPCYSGPPATEDQGTCHGGIKCAADLTCVGEVLPQDGDDCTTSAREDCLPGLGAACSGGPLGHGVITENESTFIPLRVPTATDDQKRAVGAAGYLGGTYFDGTTLAAADTSTVMWGLDENLALAWRATRPGPSEGSVLPRSIAMEGDDVVLSLQRLDGIISLDVERWAWGGAAPLSTRTFAFAASTFAPSNGIARSNGRTFVVFTHDGAADLDGDGASDGEATDVLRSYVAALDDTGATLWFVDPQPGADIAIHSVSVAGDDVWISGMTVAAANLGCAQLVPADSAFLARYDAATGECGVAGAVGSLGGLAELNFTSSFVAATPDGVVSLIPAATVDAVLRDRDLGVVWSHPLDPTLYPGTLAFDPFGHVLVAGGTTIDLTTTAFAQKLHRDTGTPLWIADVTHAATDGYAYFMGGASRSDGSTILGGSFTGTVALQGTAYTAGPSPSTFYEALAP